MLENLYDWQRDCLERWKANGGRGIVNVVTGAGKTMLAVAAIAELTQTVPVGKLRVKIVVPKNFLLAQWSSVLRRELKINRSDIGFRSGVRKDPINRTVMIYVVNTARYSLAGHIKADMDAGLSVFLIADECHHYGTAENSRIFNFIPFIPNQSNYYSLGLSATPHSPQFGAVLVPALGKEIYRYGFAEAMSAEIISRFAVFHVRLEFHADEAKEYASYTDSLMAALDELKTRAPMLRGALGGRFYALLETLSASGDFETASLAGNVRALLFQRKEVIYRARARISCVIFLLTRFRPSAKVIIFTERIETAELIYSRVKEIYPGEAGIYHSEMNDRVRDNVLSRFESREIRILISCRALDEGLNVPETDAGIVVSCTASDRQRIQRLGRILRRGGNSVSCLYYLYVEKTAEGDVLLKELSGVPDVPVIETEYLEDEDLLVNESYYEAAGAVDEFLTASGWSAERVREIRRNLLLGSVSGDWLLTEDACRELANEAKSKAEANYYMTMLLMARAREGNRALT